MIAALLWGLGFLWSSKGRSWIFCATLRKMAESFPPVFVCPIRSFRYVTKRCDAMFVPLHWVMCPTNCVALRVARQASVANIHLRED
jgi:hypothetical protein